MNFSRLGRSGLQVSRLGIGTMGFGLQLDEAAAHQVLDKAYDFGMNFIDTAEIYPASGTADTHGLAEAIVGRWLKRRPRDSIIISTKLAGASDRPQGPRLDWVRGGLTVVDRSHVVSACEASLRRLGTDYIDLYQPHWPDRTTPVEIQIDAISRLIEQGKVRYFGLSNETAWGLTTFCRAAGAPQSRPVAVQNAYNLLQRRFEYSLAEACSNENVGFIAYAPLAMGLLSGKYNSGAVPERVRLRMMPRYGKMYLSERILTVSSKYVALAEAHGLEPVEMAYAWVNQQPFVATMLSSCSHPDQLQAFICSSEVRLSDTLLAEIDSIRQMHDARWNMLD
jgi:aryl-alcohol dehydrogenase-like predicted oxidoreductase